MNYLQAVFLGALQGFTEFLPISSSGHLFLTQHFWGLVPNLHFEILLHGASLLAVLILFRKKISLILNSWFKFLTKDSQCSRHYGILGLKLLLSTVMTFPIAYLIESNFDQLLSVKFIASTLIITGGFILLAEKLRPTHERGFSWKMAILLGLVQGFAPLPGISRSGITIAFLIFSGLKRRHAAEISFLLAIPTILAALMFSWLKQGTALIMTPQILIACVIAFLGALVAMTWMVKLVEKKWIYFAPYCFILGLILFVL